jgi:uncharacterized 2Fe-2S/4Fe-4S cluster protein (DUF4445 family)
MNERVSIELQPLGKKFTAEQGTALRDILFAEGVEFPCGGRGRCKGCRTRVLAGSLPVTPDDARLLTAEETSGGWRLACRAVVRSDLKLEVAQWDAPILSDDSRFDFTPREGLGIAVDLGTTTVAAQLLDLRTARVLAVQTALNQQARHGGDIMSRIEFALHGGAGTLTAAIRGQIGEMVADLIAAADRRSNDVARIVIVGNTAMHHLFCGIDVAPLSHSPFEPINDGLQNFSARELGWPGENGVVYFLPCLGGFVGSDILAGILATKLHESELLRVLIDLGTNGEIVLGNRERLFCASTAAGPAFEGARISMGMRAAQGAISEVTARDGTFECRVLGNVPPRGICGSGLVDAVAAALETRAIRSNGRFSHPGPLELVPPVRVTQADVRELQLAKGAIAAGVELLLKRIGASAADLVRVDLAGAFGNYINRASAKRIGLLNFPPERVEAAGNTALLGAKLALFENDLDFEAVRKHIEHVPLGDNPEFQDVFVNALGFAPASR